MKRLFFLVATMTIGLSASAQAALLVLLFGDQLATETFHLSIDAGANYRQWNLEQGDPAWGWHFGLGTHYQFAEKWQLVAEFTPLNGGGARNTPALTSLPIGIDSLLSNRSNQWQVNTIDLPILIRYSVTPHFHVASGPIFSLITSAKEIRKAEYYSGETITTEANIKDLFNGVQYGWSADLSYSLSDARKGKGMDFRLRYSTYFNSALKSGEGRMGQLQAILTFPFIL